MDKITCPRCGRPGSLDAPEPGDDDVVIDPHYVCDGPHDGTAERGCWNRWDIDPLSEDA